MALKPLNPGSERVELHSISPLTIGVFLGKVSHLAGLESRIVENQLARDNVTLIRGDACFRNSNTIEVRSDNDPLFLGASHILVAVGTIPPHHRELKLTVMCPLIVTISFN